MIPTKMCAYKFVFADVKDITSSRVGNKSCSIKAMITFIVIILCPFRCILPS